MSREGLHSTTMSCSGVPLCTTESSGTVVAGTAREILFRAVACVWSSYQVTVTRPVESSGDTMMSRRQSLMVCIVLLYAATAGAQTIISASRRIDWTQAGVPGGIPTRTTVCATLNPGATAAQI